MSKIKIIYGLEAVGGGALKHLTYLVTRLNKEMFDITVVLSSKRNDTSISEIDQIMSTDVKVVFLPICKKIHLIKDFISFLKIFNILKVGDYDIVHAHSSKAGGLFRLAAFILGNKNVLYTPHCFYFQGLMGIKRKVFVIIEKLLARITSYIIVSESEKKEILKNHIIQEKYIQNINNAIDFDDYQHTFELNETLNEYSIQAGKVIVGAIGRLTPQKDWETYIYAANEVLKKYTETIFLITGEGELWNDIQKLIFSLGLETKIIMTGYVREIHKIFGILDVYVNTSLWEGLPYVFLEAMKYKKPIIATNTGNEGIIAHEKSGFITPVKDYHAIAKNIIKLIEDKQKALQMGKEGNEILYKKYSFELFIKNHEALYQKMALKSQNEITY